MIPQTIGRYSIIRELGHGAMGIVYEAEDPNIGRRVALKVVKTDQIGANREDVLRRFKNEAKAAGNLNHPNIITIHDAGEHEGMLFIAMEYVQGTNLADLIAQQGRMAPAKVVDITRQVCAGLDFAHTRGIIHRDIKPANIMLTDALVKITDFGIANVGDGMTITGTVVGTPNYMSPEQVLGKTLDGRSDLFSVGVMLYQMVTGERPFEGQSITTIMYKIVHEEPIAPRKLDSTIHPGLSAIIEKALAKAPEARFQSGSEMSAALENYKQLGSGPVTLTGNESTATITVPPTAVLNSLPDTQTYTSATQQTTYPTMAQQPPTIQTPPEKKRGFSPFLLGCFGIIALGIISITLISIVATIKSDKKKKNPVTINIPSDTAGEPEAPVPPNPGASTGAPPAAVPPAKVVERAPAKPAKTKATLTLNSTPPGAQVILDGSPTDKRTPTSVSIERGEHAIALHLPGFQDASAKFKVSGGEEFEFAPELVPVIPGFRGMRVNPNIVVPNVPMPDLSHLQELERNGALTEQQSAEIKLWEKWGALQRAGQLSIMVNSRPQGASILVDGKDTRKKTPDVIRSEAGRFTVRVEMPGYEPFEKQVSVAPNRGPTVVNAPLVQK
jgi:eukaryotic-like serine/threonine-protein kinase